MCRAEPRARVGQGDREWVATDSLGVRTAGRKAPEDPDLVARVVQARLMILVVDRGPDARKFVGPASVRGIVLAAQADRSAAARPLARVPGADQAAAREVAQVGVPVRGRECVAVMLQRLYRGGAHALP